MGNKTQAQSKKEDQIEQEHSQSRDQMSTHVHQELRDKEHSQSGDETLPYLVQKAGDEEHPRSGDETLTHSRNEEHVVSGGDED